MSDSECLENRGNMSPGDGESGCHRPSSPIIKQEQRSPRPVVPDTHMGIRFTNFFIDEILKPHFGKNDRDIPQVLPSALKSEFSFLSEKFSGLIHRPMPCLKQTVKCKPLEQSAALDLRRDRVVKKDNPRQQTVAVATNLPVIETTHDENSESLRSRGDCSSPNSSQSSCSTPPSSPSKAAKDKRNLLWPAWVYCTRYSDRPSSGPRSRRNRRKEKIVQEKRPRTAFSASQLERLKKEFENSRYLTEIRRQDLARELNLNESQIKIWFQNKRAKLKKSTGVRNGLALHLMAQGLYNHSTSGQREDEEIDVEG